MGNGMMLKVCLLALLPLACLAEEERLTAEHRTGGVLLGPEPAVRTGGPPVVSDIETELESELREALTPGFFVAAPRYRVRPLYPAWSLYPAARYAPAPTVHSAGTGGAVPWYWPAVVRHLEPYQYQSPVLTGRHAPSVAASRLYDVTVSSAHAPQLPE